MKEYTPIRKFYAWTGFIALWVLVVLALLLFFAEFLPKKSEAAQAPHRRTYTGLASYYDYDLPGAKGYTYSFVNRTAASRDYPRGTFVRVLNLENERATCVRINDYVDNFGVIIDLSSRAFADIAPLQHGLIKVELRQVDNC